MVQYLCLGPVAADVIEVVLAVWPANDSTVQDVSLLRRGSVDEVNVVAAASQGRVGVDGRVWVGTHDVGCCGSTW